MNINIKTTNFSLTEAINDYVGRRLDKVARIVEDDPSVKCDIELGRTTTHHHKGDVFRAEIHMTGADGLNAYASIEREDLYAAVDEVRDAIMRDLTSLRKRRASRIKRGGARIKAMIKGLWTRRP